MVAGIHYPDLASIFIHIGADGPEILSRTAADVPHVAYKTAGMTVKHTDRELVHSRYRHDILYEIVIGYYDPCLSESIEGIAVQRDELRRMRIR